MKHRLTAIWSTRYARMMRLLRKHEAKRTLTFPCGKATLHRAKLCFIFHTPQGALHWKKHLLSQVLFSDSPCWVSVGKRLNIVLSSGGAQSASWQSQASAGDRQRHTTASGAKRNHATSAFNSHAYSRKYSRFARLRLLGFKTPYFRNLPSQNNTQLFCSVAYRLRLVQSLWAREC